MLTRSATNIVKVICKQKPTTIPILTNQIEALKEYFNGMMNMADHHADNVNEIVLALIGSVIWRAEGVFEVKPYDGSQANILRMTVDGTHYCF